MTPVNQELKAMSQYFFIPLFVSSCICLSHPVFAQSAKNATVSENGSAFTGKITGNKVRLRAAPDLDGKIVKELVRDEIILVTGEKNGFYAVEPFKNIKGYVFRAYVLDDIVEASNVNVRLEPSVEGTVIGQLSTGDSVTGSIAKANSKWLEIDLPKSTRFYVAKEYVDTIGKPELFETIQKRKSEVSELLTNACQLSQNEMRKPFDQINIELIKANFTHILDNYSDFKEQHGKAKEYLSLIQETYLKNKISYLESKNKEYSEECSKRLALLEDKLQEDQLQIADLEPIQEETKLPSQSATFHTSIAGNVWEGIENNLFSTWLKDHPNKTKHDFYQEQLPFAVMLKGVIEPYNLAVKNRPGDYVIKVNGLPVAFLYSTSVNLHEKVGKMVTVWGLKRANNHFAYPAYFALSIQ